MRRLGWIAPVIVAVGLAATAPLLAGAVHAERAGGDQDERLYYPDGRFLRHASLGFSAPAADYAWLQAIQYYGGYRQGEHDLRYFEGLVDAVVTLDPRFDEAYHFASLVYCFDDADYDRAVAILRQGVLANPDDWRLHFDLGFVHYVFKREFAVASTYFEAAAELPGSSDFCRRFAAFARRRAGDQEGSLALWQNLYQTTESAEMRELAAGMIEKCQQTLDAQPLPGTIGPPSPGTRKDAS